jgi:eukaryotic-like serine/threonine-protein kinase
MAPPNPATQPEADLNLLFGVLALQADVISQSQFIDACSSWAGRKDTSLADLLESRGWLSSSDRAAVERLVQRKLKKHEGDPRSSLADVMGRGVRQTIAMVPEAEVQESLVFLPPNEEAGRPLSVDSPGQTRGRYHLTRPHAAGGIGQVWLAQDRDIGRSVALKELRPEKATRPMFVDRFVEEARITGQLEHPGIVPVYELARSPSDGQPFYTMRFISGRTLNDAVAAYHARRRSGQAEPLELSELLGAFVTVCNTVAYANSRGVVHRDLKGSNVVLGDFGEVIVLDWGIAKIIGDPAGAPVEPGPAAPQTQAPPAQPAALQSGFHLQPVTTDRPSHDLSVQGQVIGTPVYMAPEQAEGRIDAIDARTDVYGLGAMLYEILTGRPPFGIGDTMTTLRRVVNEPPDPPRKHVPAVPPALEAVCLKALAKRPEDRYPTGIALAREIQHFLADAPVAAYPDPWSTRLMRWARRHRTVVAASAALLITAVGALTVGMVLLGAANARTQEQRDRAEENVVQVQQAQRRTGAITSFLTDDLLGQAAPDQNARDKRITVEEVLGRAANKIGNRYADDPEVEAAVRLTIGDTYYKLGLYGQAEEHLRRTMDVRRHTLGDDHPDTIQATITLSEVLSAAGKAEEGVTLARSALDAAHRAVGPEHKLTMWALNNLATALYRQGRLAEVEPLFRESLDTRRRMLGPEDAWTLLSANNLARLFMEEGRLTEAEPILRQAIAVAGRSTGAQGGSAGNVTLNATINLGALLTELGKTQEAEPMLREIVERCRRVQGPEHQYTLTAVDNLHRLFLRQEKFAEAEAGCRKNLQAHRQYLGTKHPKTLTAADTLARALVGQVKWANVEREARETLQMRRQALPANHYDLANSMEMLGLALDKTGRASEAEPLLREGVRLRREAFPKGDRRTAASESILGGALTNLKHYDEAEPLLLSSYDALTKAQGVSPRDVREARARLAALYQAWGKPDQAAQWRERETEPVKP